MTGMAYEELGDIPKGMQRLDDEGRLYYTENGIDEVTLSTQCTNASVTDRRVLLL